MNYVPAITRGAHVICGRDFGAVGGSDSPNVWRARRNRVAPIPRSAKRVIVPLTSLPPSID